MRLPSARAGALVVCASLLAVLLWRDWPDDPVIPQALDVQATSEAELPGFAWRAALDLSRDDYAEMLVSASFTPRSTQLRTPVMVSVQGLSNLGARIERSGGRGCELVDVEPDEEEGDSAQFACMGDPESGFLNLPPIVVDRDRVAWRAGPGRTGLAFGTSFGACLGGEEITDVRCQAGDASPAIVGVTVPGAGRMEDVFPAPIHQEVALDDGEGEPDDGGERRRWMAFDGNMDKSGDSLFQAVLVNDREVLFGAWFVNLLYLLSGGLLGALGAGAVSAASNQRSAR